MKIYNYNRTTYEYIGSSDVLIDPLETKKQNKNIYLLPANSTPIEPPDVRKNEVQVFDPINNKWDIFHDLRGKEFYSENGSKIIINKINENVPDGATTIPPPDNYFMSFWNGKKWEEKALVFHGKMVKNKKDVDRIICDEIIDLGEGKAHTEKMLTGNKECQIWDEFIKKRNILLAEGNDFIFKNSLK